MARELMASPPVARKGWAARLLHGLGRGGNAGPAAVAASPRRAAPAPSTSRLRSMARQLIAEERYTFLLLREAVDDISEADAKPAWVAIADQMALVPEGVVPVYSANGSLAVVEMPAYYLDRHQVTNRQYQRFVEAGGYDSLEIWPKEVWPSVMKFMDRTHQPGPRDWEQGRPPTAKLDHPVVGVSWYEAAAYASWVGKRLPTASEWQKAGGWPEHLSGGSCLRYPWGNVYEPDRANLWASGNGRTVAVDAYPSGATPNGIHQMTGNVWEWLADTLDAIPCRHGESFQVWRPTRRIAGGAFDTYFPAEATCHFVTGQPELDRRENIGFRCAISASRLRPRA